MAWYTIEEAVDNGKLPLNIARGLNWVCPVCHYPTLVDDELTHMKDANFWCPEYLGQRGASLFQHFEYKDIGYKTLAKLARRNNLRNHFQLLDPSIWPVGSKGYNFCMQPREATLVQIVQLASIPDLQGKAFNIFYNYHSFDQYLSMNPNSEYHWAREMMRDAVKYIKVKPPLSGIPKTLIISGNIKGTTKDKFVAKLNREYGDVFAFNRLKSWRNDVDFVISDDRSYSKYEEAVKRGIPVYGSEAFWEYMKLLKQMVLHHISEEKGVED